jgi:deoxyribose-phosphate aldolase
MTKANLASLIDHTLLKADVTKEQIIQLCKEAKEHTFASVCVNPTWVKTCASELQGSPVKVCTVIGFPLGATTPDVKEFETKQSIANGASEVDMVINIGALKDGDNDLVERDILAVVEAAKGKALVKVIIETALLNEEEMVRACIISQRAGADYVKTSTGFSTSGATISDVALMRKTVGPDLGVKASGGVRDRQAVLEMVEAGATRIGASSGVAIVSGEDSDTKTGY